MVKDWTRAEVEIIIAGYLEMLQKEQAGIPYSKTETRQRILPLLKDRSQGAVEFNNRNISAVLATMVFGQIDITFKVLSSYASAKLETLAIIVGGNQRRRKGDSGCNFNAVEHTPGWRLIIRY